MPASPANPNVDWYFEKKGPWKEAYAKLRTIALQSGLDEDLKWGHPCYTLSGKNVFLMHGFKDYCALLFHKGALLKDAAELLVQQTENVQAARQLRFTDVQEVVKKERTRKQSREACRVERRAGEVPVKTTTEFNMPEEFLNTLQQMPAVKKAFYALTPGRQRGYLLHFSSAKQAKTGEAHRKEHRADVGGGQGDR
ncbi:MAG: DUF1801 domain-containing protein [Flavobacteriales bacterium]|nr:DUF1801 domain-containing protein [Flavobacteriales bacterium]